MDFVLEKPVLEVDKVRPSRPGGEGTGGESTVKDADGEVLLPITASEDEEPALMHAIVNEELRPPVAEVACPLAIVVDLDVVLGLADAALPQRSMSHLLAFHRFRKLRWKSKEVLGPGEYRDYAGGPLSWFLRHVCHEGYLKAIERGDRQSGARDSDRQGLPRFTSPRWRIATSCYNSL
jgi:hypothetical protein